MYINIDFVHQHYVELGITRIVALFLQLYFTQINSVVFEKT